MSCPAKQLAAKPAALAMVEAAAPPLASVTVLQCFAQHGFTGPGQALLVVGGIRGPYCGTVGGSGGPY